MNRRQFVAAGLGAAAVASAPGEPALGRTGTLGQGIRGEFPRLTGQHYLNAASGTPLGRFAERGMQRYLEYAHLGPGDGRRDYVAGMRSNVRQLFGDLIAAKAEEVALVPSTKAGEQIVLDALDPARHGRNIVTNDMHFGGCLHNLEGLRRSGVDVRIVKGRDWDVPLDAMEAAIDRNTALVTVTLLSNVTGRIEPMRELAELAHARGALVYADIIQAAGIVPLDLQAMGVDFAAANGYKWLYGVHGAGFLYVRADLQGTALPDRLFPGFSRPNYPPWVDRPDPDLGDLTFTPRSDASRYEPGHVSYLSYCGVYEGLRFLHRIGVDAALAHSVRLNQRLLSQIDPDRYRRLTPDVERSPILSLALPDPRRLEPHLRAMNVVVTLGPNYVRVSPAIYNDDRDIDRLAEALNAEV